MEFRKEIIGDATLYLGDCMEVMQTLDKVDAVVTDPPYDEEAHRFGRRTRATFEKAEMAELNFAKFPPENRLKLSEILKKLSIGWVISFCQIESIGLWKEAHENAGLKYRRSCIWRKPDGMPQFSGDRPGMGYETFVCSWSGKSKSIWNGGGKHGIYVYPKGNAGANHQTEKPIALMQDIIFDFTQLAETILDPFMGSGTTGVACMNLGRKFIGIEIDEKYFEIACKRIKDAQKQGKLFAQPKPKVEQQGLF